MFILFVSGLLALSACEALLIQPTPTLKPGAVVPVGQSTPTFEPGAIMPRIPGTATLLDNGYYLVEIPVYPDAQGVQRQVLDDDWAVRITTFRTPDSAEQVNGFYTQLLLPQGWRVDREDANSRSFSSGLYPNEILFDLTISTEERDGHTFVTLRELQGGYASVFYPTTTPSPTHPPSSPVRIVPTTTD